MVSVDTLSRDTIPLRNSKFMVFLKPFLLCTTVGSHCMGTCVTRLSCDESFEMGDFVFYENLRPSVAVVAILLNRE
jgi:hypothetical protein